MPSTTVEGEDRIASYTGAFPSPLPLMWYVPEGNEVLRVWFPPEEIRGWIRNAAEYQDVPHCMLAVILQQENGPNATWFQKIGQFGERTLTTAAAIADDVLFGLVPDAVAGGSSGFANMSRATLRNAALYSATVHNRPPLPDDVRYRVLGYDQDTRVPGDDWKADLYYASAHLRELIDRQTGTTGYTGVLARDDVRGVFRRYNGSGSLAEKYADDAIALLEGAIAGDRTLYFYQR
ncbi:MAG: hypothetical protein KC501_10230 [Myxococcales bacterium]|nr:hypothetical protein [Myxococcales bacterium]